MMRAPKYKTNNMCSKHNIYRAHIEIDIYTPPLSAQVSLFPSPSKYNLNMHTYNHGISHSLECLWFLELLQVRVWLTAVF